MGTGASQSTGYGAERVEPGGRLSADAGGSWITGRVESVGVIGQSLREQQRPGSPAQYLDTSAQGLDVSVDRTSNL